jgi:hypothetical protein
MSDNSKIHELVLLREQAKSLLQSVDDAIARAQANGRRPVKVAPPVKKRQSSAHLRRALTPREQLVLDAMRDRARHYKGHSLRLEDVRFEVAEKFGQELPQGSLYRTMRYLIRKGWVHLDKTVSPQMYKVA